MKTEQYGFFTHKIMQYIMKYNFKLYRLSEARNIPAYITITPLVPWPMWIKSGVSLLTKIEFTLMMKLASAAYT